MAKPQFLLITFPAQGHVNPAIEFAKRLIHSGAEVTFFTTDYALRRMIAKQSTATINGLSFALFSNGYNDGFKKGDDAKHYSSEMKRRGSKALAELIESRANEGRPFTCSEYTLLLQWASEVAAEFRLPSVLLWVQPATVFGVYYYYFHGFGDVIKEKFSIGDDSCSIALPGLSLMSICDLPSFMYTSNINSSIMQFFEEQFEVLEKQGNQKVLVNTFDELEVEALRAICKVNLIGIGPLIPSAFQCSNEKDPSDTSFAKDPSDTSFGSDLFQCSNDYMEWLNSKPEGSVVYVSFGSFYVLKKSQREELAKGLLDFGRPFLWVITEKQIKDQNNEEEEEELSCREELEKLGKIVPWCSQMEVLSNSSLACFVTHCGWNSSMESLSFGVPMVAFPQWLDQITNAKLIEDVWKIGVRVKANKDGVAEGNEIKRCLDLVTGEEEKGVEIRRNAEKWKSLAREAVKEGGSSDRNFKAFVDEMIGEAAFCSHQ
ncbi:hypothetical protein UlMin_010448 [Ulmus minor]